MINVSAAMGGQFAFAAAELTAEIERLGPSPLRKEGKPAGSAGTETEAPTAQADADSG
jgi:hypothetical protein